MVGIQGKQRNELLDVIAQKNSPIAPTDLSVYQARRIPGDERCEALRKAGPSLGTIA